MDSLSSNSIYLVFLAFFPLLSLVHAKHDTVTPINRDLYHSSADLMKQIEALVNRHPNKLSIETIESGNKGYQAQVDVVTYCRDSNEDDKSKFRILLTFGQHGRELITSELALRILSILSEEEFLPKMDRKSLNSTLDKLLIKVVPMENVNGRKRVEGGDLCERRNGRGVDLNRNWSVDWGKKEEDYDPYEENPGTAPFSEPESQIMRKLALSFQPHLWVNVHSGMQWKARIKTNKISKQSYTKREHLTNCSQLNRAGYMAWSSWVSQNSFCFKSCRTCSSYGLDSVELIPSELQFNQNATFKQVTRLS